MSLQINEVFPDETVEPYDWSTRYEIDYPLYGLGALPSKKKDKDKDKGKKDAATVDMSQPPESFVSRHKWKIVGGVGAAALLGALVWYFKRR